jgi:type III secretion protein J
MSLSLRHCLCLLLLLCTAACRERIQHGLDERQANELQTVLAERGLDARKVPEAGKKPTWAIEVDEAQASDAVRILAELGLPRPVEETGCDVFGGGGLIRSPVEEQLCRVRVLERGIEKTLQGIDGVLLAVMGVVVTGLAVALVFLAMRLRASQAEAAAPTAAPPVPARPVVAANAARKVA